MATKSSNTPATSVEYVKLVSTVKYPVEMKYDGESFMIAPRATISGIGQDIKVDKSKLSPAPQGIVIINV